MTTMPTRDFASEQKALARKQALATMLTQMGSQPLDPNQMAGGMVVPVSPVQGLAQMGQALAGAMMARRADKKESALAGDKAKALADALGGAPMPTDRAGKLAYASRIASIDPDLAKSLYADALKGTKYGTTPQTGIGADGKPLQFLVGEDGSTRPLDMAPLTKKEVAGNGQVWDPYSGNPTGQVFNDPNKAFGVGADGQPVANVPAQQFATLNDNITVGPDGKPVSNTPAVGAKAAIAGAGATRINTNVIPNTVGGEIGKAAIGDLSSRRTQAQTAASGITSANRVMQLIDSGQIIAGAGAGAVTTLAKYLPVGGKDFREKLANTQALMADLAKSALALKDQMPGPLSNADIVFLQRAAAGDINLEPAAIRRVAELNAMANSRFLDTFNRDVQATTGFLGGQGMGSLPFDYRVEAPAIYQAPQPATGGIKVTRVK